LIRSLAPFAPFAPLAPLTSGRWAHNRSELALALTLLHLNPSLLVTVLIHSNRSKASALEIAQYPHISQPERMRVIHYGNEGQVEGEGMFNPRGGFRAQITQETEGWAEKLAKVGRAGSRGLGRGSAWDSTSFESPIIGEWGGRVGAQESELGTGHCAGEQLNVVEDGRVKRMGVRNGTNDLRETIKGSTTDHSADSHSSSLSSTP
jgi:hypothetical protein